MFNGHSKLETWPHQCHNFSTLDDKKKKKIGHSRRYNNDVTNSPFESRKRRHCRLYNILLLHANSLYLFYRFRTFTFFILFRYLSDGETATCMCLNNNQDAFVGTDSGRVFRCNLGGHKVWPTYYCHEDTGNRAVLIKYILWKISNRVFFSSFFTNRIYLFIYFIYWNNKDLSHVVIYRIFYFDR